MRRNGFAVRGLAAAAALSAAMTGATVVPAQAAYVQAGVLTCNVAPSVGLIVTARKDLTCTFAPNSGRAENYVGVIRNVGLNLGVTGAGVIVWAVLASVTGPTPRGALAGTYGGASAEASLIIGAGANLLVGGNNNSFAFQPLSVQGQIGLNFAAGISSLTLTAI
jgi:hypothetical protein